MAEKVFLLIGGVLVGVGLVNAWTGALNLAQYGDKGTNLNLPGGGNLSEYDIGFIAVGLLFIGIAMVMD